MEIPGYKIIGELGQGGMSRVYLAIQENFDREVALKIMLPELLADPTFSERFLREAKIVGQLSHPHIVAVFDVGIHEKHHYISMAYHDDGDLKEKVKNGIALQQALQVTQQIASALEFAHGQGFVHRDIKPENVLFRKDGTVVLSDFGISKAMDSNTNMTSTGTAIGTPRYMSPEQASGKTVDGRADLYSLGVMLFEMLTGKVPYDAEDSIAIAVMHVTESVPDLPEHIKLYQPLIDMMMAKNPDKRFQTGAEVVTDIQIYLNSQVPNISGPTGTVMVGAAASLSQQTLATSLSQQVAAANVSQQTVAAQISQETMAYNGASNQKKSVGLGIVLMLLAFFVLAGGGGFYYYTENAKKVAAKELADKQLAEKKLEEKIKKEKAVVASVANQKAPKKIAKKTLLEISSSPDNANIYINNIYKGITPVKLPDMKGNVSIKISKDGYSTWTKKIKVRNGQTEKIFADLIRKVAKATPKSIPKPIKQNKPLPTPTKIIIQKPEITDFALFVALNPGDARVKILNSKKKFVNGMRLDKGEYLLTISKEGYKTANRSVKISKDMQLMVNLEKIVKKKIGTKPGQIIEDKLAIGGYGPKMMIVPSGQFLYGSPKREYKRSKYEARPVNIYVPEKFAIGVYEVTYDDYKKYTDDMGLAGPVDKKKFGKGKHPMNTTTWVNARAYAKWLTSQTGFNYRLPTEQEWEYAARAGSSAAFSSGNCLSKSDGNFNGVRGYDKCAPTGGAGKGKTMDVGSFSPNSWGLYDIHGNVWEWTISCFSKKPDKTLQGSLRQVNKSCRKRVLRGGAYNSGPRRVRIAQRYFFPENKASFLTGFRLLREM